MIIFPNVWPSMASNRMGNFEEKCLFNMFFSLKAVIRTIAVLSCFLIYSICCYTFNNAWSTLCRNNYISLSAAIAFSRSSSDFLFLGWRILSKYKNVSMFLICVFMETFCEFQCFASLLHELSLKIAALTSGSSWEDFSCKPDGHSVWTWNTNAHKKKLFNFFKNKNFSWLICFLNCGSQPDFGLQGPTQSENCRTIWRVTQKVFLGCAPYLQLQS